MLAVAATLLLGGCATAVEGAASSGAGGADASAPPAGEGDDLLAASAAVAPAPAAPVVVADVPIADADLEATAAAPTVPPTRVEVPALGLDVAVVPEGIDDGGALALPADPAIASWYRFGPSSWSAAGTTVIAAHVDSPRYGIGPFAELRDAAPGTAVRVHSADGRSLDYVVDEVTVLEKTGVDWPVVFDRAGPARLALVTCGGEFDRRSGHYLSNVIVTATPVPAAP